MHLAVFEANYHLVPDTHLPVQTEFLDVTLSGIRHWTHSETIRDYGTVVCLPDTTTFSTGV